MLMPTATLREKLYGSGSPATFMETYSSLLRGLKVHLDFAGTTDRGWVQVDISGEDETAALNYLDREIGLVPVSADNLEKFSVISGKIVFSGKSESELYVDVGVFSPKVYDVVLSAQRLRAQLADGKEISLRILIELFCLQDNMPLEVKVVQDVDEQNKNVEGRLTEAQVSVFGSWVHDSFDRLIILGAHYTDVERAVKLSRSYRDTIKINSLGTLEHAVLCKLGTDAVGLIPKVGRYLPESVLVPFSPKKVLDAVGNQSFNW
jgi:hypothetical protein